MAIGDWLFFRVILISMKTARSRPSFEPGALPVLSHPAKARHGAFLVPVEHAAGSQAIQVFIVPADPRMMAARIPVPGYSIKHVILS